MDWTNVFINFGSALGGALAGAYASYVLTRQQDIRRSRVERTLRLMEQYNSPDFLKMRGDASRILDAYFETHEPCSWNELYDGLKENYTPVSAVYHFFQQVLFFHESGEIDDNMAQKYWARHYNHWYSKRFGSLSDASIRNGDETENSTTRRLLHWFSSKQIEK
jgi:hypothetical protein